MNDKKEIKTVKLVPYKQCLNPETGKNFAGEDVVFNSYWKLMIDRGYVYRVNEEPKKNIRKADESIRDSGPTEVIEDRSLASKKSKK